MNPDLTILGGGLAGSEAAWQAAERGLRVRLYEMRPERSTGVHQTADLAELVCSGSLKSLLVTTASGLLNHELESLGSLILRCGRQAAIPGGQALAVDRREFAAAVTAAVEGHPRIQVVRQEALTVPREGLVIVASGPLTSAALAADLAALTGAGQMAFYDAIAPTVEYESIDLEPVYRASRYGRGGADYLNCPLTLEQYTAFHEALVSAERHAPKCPEDTVYFESCLPIEIIAERSFKGPTYGPLKPVGLDDPRTGRRPYAVVQLRQENRAATLWSLVGFQTQLKRGEQERIFRLIPGLERAVFARYGQVHRNTFLNSPQVLDPTLQLRAQPEVLLAGQLIGVEGYMESAAAGWLAGVNAARVQRGQEALVPPATTMLGALVRYVSDPWCKSFQPMNANFGLLPHLDVKPKDARKQAYADRALADLAAWSAASGALEL
ncbi:MAG: methylenetetrahydrofolate--tRNA-(uracil(54)-C(5))-methyltransferase (FADH(2)-oxidizing) TrmFO [Fimbriimonadaceae bacterium]|nr:methylenetetrahydrofolate--tRNA-(uracil(54)-C(5))-methyltransferase (FADH(2)-oxidizing) TrmFO [Fimbriimonadaceae bacterium]